MILVISCGLIAGGFLIWRGIYLPKEIKDSEEILFEVAEGESFFSISENLEKKELIKNKLFFQIYVVFNRRYKNLKAGFYHLGPSMNIKEIVEKIVEGRNIQIKVTIPEGFTIKQIEERINEKLGIRDQGLGIGDFKIKEYKKDYKFLKDVPDDFNLEGFLFPDTYFFEPDIQEKEIIEIFLKNFDKKFTPYRNEVSGAELTTFDIVIMASLLEKEVKTLEDKKLVSGILWKRLNNSIPLQVDATVTFITGKKTTKISKQETEIDSPYNTYKYLGLPIGPICNPGLESIRAAIQPEKSDFWYYLSTPDEETIFSKTLEDHNLAKQEYLK